MGKNPKHWCRMKGFGSITFAPVTVILSHYTAVIRIRFQKNDFVHTRENISYPEQVLLNMNGTMSNPDLPTPVVS